MTLHDYVRLLRRGWLSVVGLTLLGVGLANVLTLMTTPTYTVVSTVYVTTVGDVSPSGLQQGNDFSTQRALTYAGLASTDAVLDQAATVLDDDVDELRLAISPAVRATTSLIDISASASQPALAAGRANAVADALTTEAPLLDAPSPDSPVDLSVVTRAEVPEQATTPRPRNNVIIGAVIGLALGVGLVIVTQALDTRIRGVSDLPRGPKLATVTSLQAVRGRTSRPTPTADVRLESFRHLRANLQFGTHTGSLIAVAGITAASKAFEVASHLASVLGETGVTVVLVDVDLRQERRRRRLDAEYDRAAPGVADVLSGTARVDEVIVDGPVAGVSLIPAGSLSDSSAQALSTAPMRDFLIELTARFDYVLLSCPPVIERAEAAVIAALSQSSLLVVASGATTRFEFLYALELLEGVGATSVSVAIDHVRGPDMGNPVWRAREPATLSDIRVK